MFKSARIKLTSWYLLIIVLISLSFSLVVYNTLTQEVGRFARMQRFRIEQGENFDPLHLPPRRYEPSNLDLQLIKESRERIIIFLACVNLGILATSGILGYFLAGRTLKPIQDMVDEQNRFIGDASHEFRTPLTALKSSMEVFLKDPNAKMVDAKRLIKDGIDDVDRLTQLSNSLLQMTQYQKPNGNLKFEAVQLSETITEAVNKIKPLADKKHVTIEHQKNRLKVWGNKYSIIDLLVILLDNAVKFSHQDGKIQIEATKTDHTIQIKVIDSGEGIAEKDFPYIFDRFYKADTSRSQTDDSKPGYGLGLSIAQSIVKSHHGNIKAESVYGKGTTIIVNLPSYKDNSVRVQKDKLG